jgi:hypothetical protein
MKIWPPLTSSRPASMRREVDLPQPEGPTRDEELAVDAMSSMDEVTVQ